MKKQKITVDTIMSWGPCEEYTKTKIKKLLKGVCGDMGNITYRDILKLSIPVNDKLWVLLRPEFIPERQLHEIGIWCWEEIARPVWEKHHPDDRRPHDAVATKRLWLDGKATDAELAAARASAWAAARAAASASAWASARASVWASARTSEYNTTFEKILKHVEEIFKVFC